MYVCMYVCMYAFSLLLIAVIKRWNPGITPVSQRIPSVRKRLLKVIMRNIGIHGYSADAMY